MSEENVSHSPIDTVANGYNIIQKEDNKKGSKEMIISSKGRYALRVMVYLAVHHSDEYIPLKEISDKEEL